MRRALELAKKGIGFSSPNPAVGAVIVKGGRIVGEGWHKKAGSDHAEIVAIKNVMKNSGIVTVDLEPALFSNAALYVTLEPCSHDGRTPACAKAIVAAGFKKVFVGMKDPFVKVNGRGIKYLKNHGVMVEVCKASSPLAKEIRAINQPFIKWASFGLPYVIAKAGMSLDGKIATGAGESKWITSENARIDSRLLRGRYDAVLVGAGTVKSDNPELAAHGKYKNKKLLRIVLDNKLSLSTDSKVFRDESVFVASSDLASEKNKEKYRKAGIEFKSFGKDKVSLKRLLVYLAKRKIQSVFIEGGSAVLGSFYDDSLKNRDLLDKVCFYLAPKIIGGTDSLAVFGGLGADKLSKLRNLEDVVFEMVGDDLRFEGVFNFY